MSVICFKSAACVYEDELLEKVWGFEYIGNTRAVDIMVQRLRKKLGTSGEYIKTIYGVGYKLDC